jgi:hypothetical protein
MYVGQYKIVIGKNSLAVKKNKKPQQFRLPVFFDNY